MSSEKGDDEQHFSLAHSLCVCVRMCALAGNTIACTYSGEGRKESQFSVNVSERAGAVKQ